LPVPRGDTQGDDNDGGGLDDENTFVGIALEVIFNPDLPGSEFVNRTLQSAGESMSAATTI
jgi:hypothetical protein